MSYLNSLFFENLTCEHFFSAVVLLQHRFLTLNFNWQGLVLLCAELFIKFFTPMDALMTYETMSHFFSLLLEELKVRLCVSLTSVYPGYIASSVLILITSCGQFRIK